MKSFTNSQGAMSDGESEVEVVEDKPEEMEVVDMSVKERRHLQGRRGQTPDPHHPHLTHPLWTCLHLSAEMSSMK